MKTSVFPSVFTSLFAAILIVFGLAFFGCSNHVGLGEEIDLVAPELTVDSLSSGDVVLTSFAGGVYCKTGVSFAGTATDNKKVTRVYAQIKWAGDTDYVDLATATYSGKSWSLDLAFEQEGVAFIKFIAADSRNNFGTKSSKVITLFVDEDAPVASAWYIDRGSGIRYSLKEKDELVELVDNDKLSLPENKDAAQNVSFSLNANASDSMGISSISLQIYDEDGTKICDVANSGSSEYAPQFEITHDLLVSGKSALSTGCHYLEVRYTAEDVVIMPESNRAENIEVDGGWFIWWPESDEPKITNSDISDDTLTVYVSDVLSLSVFDDDELEQAYCALLTKEESAAFTLDWNAVAENPNTLIAAVTGDDASKRAKTYTASSGERDATVVLTAASSPQTMRLLAIAWDTTSAHKVVMRDVTVHVIDATTPTLLITSPKNNSIPSVTMSSDSEGTDMAVVSISGQTLDSIGCTYLEFVWVPYAVEDKVTKAKNWLDSLSDSEHESLASSKTATNDGMKLWSVPLSRKAAYGESGFYSQSFSFDVDVLSDFGDEKALDKSFVAKLIREDGNSATVEYKLMADTLAPTISPVTPAADMQIVQESADLTLEFKGVKTSGLAIDTSKYAIYRVDTEERIAISGRYDSSSGTYKAVVGKDTLATMSSDGIKPKYLFHAEDLFGNVGEDQYTLVISDLPSLKTISSTASSLCKLGDEIVITAAFSNTLYIDEANPPYIRLYGVTNSDSEKNITSTSELQAVYKSGSGSATLSFSYTVQQGDTSDHLYVYDDTPIENLSTSVALIGTTFTNRLGAEGDKTIALDGVLPTITTPEITSTASTNGDITYYREGKTLTVKVTASETVYVQGSPSFQFVTNGGGYLELPFTNCAGSVITFSKKIVKDDANGALSYVPASCLTNADAIVDKAGNALSLGNDTNARAVSVTVDTVAPDAPRISANGSTLTSGLYQSAVTFTAETSATDVSLIQYSTDGGSTWKDENKASNTNSISATQDSSAQLTARATDYAGNVSDLTEVIDLDINGSYPSFTLECINSDGNYTAGNKLIFKVSFESNMNVAANAAAYVLVSGESGQTYKQGENGGKAYLSDSSGNALSSSQSTVASVYFTYVVQDPDQFTLRVECSDVDVVLTGITDLYGNTQGTHVLSEAYVRSGITCDGVAPKVVSMTIDGYSETTTDGNVYTNGKKITLVFSEEIQKASGNIILRQVKLWPLPPVLSVSDFNTILGELGSDDKKYLAMLDSSGGYLEDAQSDLGITLSDGFALDMYHGTGQYVGPYKKSMQGLTSSFTPDTDTKFVLDFDIDIWETDTPHYFGKTYKEISSKNDANTFHKGASETGRLTIYDGSSKIAPTGDTNVRTAQGIREVLEKAGYHERVLDVTSENVDIQEDKKTVVITFPKGLCGDNDLPDGREWELVIEKGAFMDASGNYFGANNVGEIEQKDSVQSSNSQSDTGISTSNWGRYRSSVDSSDTPVVLIKDGDNYSFYSDKVATPWVRVDRYSYGLGIYQSDASGNKASQIVDKTSGNDIRPDTVEPTGYVRVRIDCETKNATLSYTKATATKTTSDATTQYSINTNSTYSTTDNLSSLDSVSSYGTCTTGSGTSTVIFAGGVGGSNGEGYKQSCKQYIVATATKTGFTDSEKGSEGIFKTVARLVTPHDRSDTNLADKDAGYQDYNMRGQTGEGGEPTIAPFPLRGGILGTPYVRRIFRNTSTKDYYFVSFEILVDSTFLGYAYRDGWRWSDQKGFMRPGEFTTITGVSTQ